jgi:hypothetical protein
MSSIAHTPRLDTTILSKEPKHLYIRFSTWRIREEKKHSRERRTTKDVGSSELNLFAFLEIPII